MENYLVELSKQLPDEIMGYKTYKMLADKAENMEDKQKLMEIANQERTHYELVKGILESYM